MILTGQTALLRGIHLLALAAALTLVPAEGASAHDAPAPAPIPLSDGVSAFADCRVDADPQDGLDPRLELEPTVAVDPSNPRRIVAAWLQGENLGVVTAASSDGGASWRRTVVPGLTTCSGGSDDIAFNPSLSFGSDGTVYLAATASGGYFPTDPRATVTRVMTARSSDGGLTWQSMPIARSELSVDYPFIAADPKLPGRAVVVWSRRGYAIDTTFAARTTDGGRTWSAPVLVRTSEAGRIQLNRVHGLGDGRYALITLDVNVPGAFASGVAAPELRALVSRSEDHGASWRDSARMDGVAGLASAVQGTSLHLGLSSAPADGTFAYDVVTSRDGAQSFGERRRVASFPAATQEPELAVDAEGTLAVVAALPTAADGKYDLRALHSHDGGRTWIDGLLAQTRLPLEQAPAFYLRPYAAGLRKGFAVVSMLAGAAAGDRTDVHFQELKAPAAQTKPAAPAKPSRAKTKKKGKKGKKPKRRRGGGRRRPRSA